LLKKVRIAAGAPGTTDRFMQKYIFPGGYIPALSETVAASERERLIVADVETLRFHYLPTPSATGTTGGGGRGGDRSPPRPAFLSLWLFYLAAAMTMFSDAGMVNHQLQYVRRRDSIPMTRDFMFEAEIQLRAVPA